MTCGDIRIDVQAAHRNQTRSLEYPEEDFAWTIEAVTPLFPIVSQLVHEAKLICARLFAQPFYANRQRGQASGLVWITFDERPGLLFKAFLISERIRGAPLNQYAPFYVWNETAALWDFVAGSGFDGIIESFGRPAILTWLPLSIEIRQGLRRDAVRSALREDMPVHLEANLPKLRQAQIDECKSVMTGDPGIALQLVAANIERWSMVRFTLRYDQPTAIAPGAHAYEVLHLSAPGRA